MTHCGRHAILTFLVASSAAACARGDDPGATGERDVIAATSETLGQPRPHGAVDSARSTEDELRRMRAEIGVASPPARLEGERSRAALVRRFIAAVEQRDTAVLRGLVMSRSEFAYLVYPESRYTRPPYRQNPALLWFLIEEGSAKGLSRAIRRVGGRPLGYVSHSCAPAAEIEGPSRMWTGCTVRRVLAPGDTVDQRLFGSILERDGRFKFVSYANEL